MAILESNTIKSTYQSLAYLFSDPEHNDAKTNKRVLACSGININMLHNSDGTLSTQQNGGYLAKQFHQNLKLAFNPNRKVQAQSIIISCSRDEFDTNDLDTQAKQLLQLANGFANKCFGDCQAVIAVQADGGHGQSGKLHAHILINSVKPRHGTSNRTMTVPTNRFSVRPLRNKLDDYLANNFELVTGRKWPGPINNQRSPESLKDLPNKAPWQRELKQTINEIKNQVTNIKDFLARLKQHEVTVVERGKKQQWTYHLKVNTSRGTKERRIRAFYQRKDKDGNVINTRGLGTDFTKQGLERYWEKQLIKQKESNSEPLSKTNVHSRKEVDHNGQQQSSEEEQLQKIKSLAADARAAAQQKQLRQHLNFEQLKRAKAEERKQYATRKAAQRNARSTSNQARSESISTEQRTREAAKRAIKAKQRRAQSNHKSADGPDF